MATTLMFCVGKIEAVLAAADDYNGYAFLAISSLTGVSVLTRYLIPTGCLIWRRFYGAPLPSRG